MTWHLINGSQFLFIYLLYTLKMWVIKIVFSSLENMLQWHSIFDIKTNWHFSLKMNCIMYIGKIQQQHGMMHNEGNFVKRVKCWTSFEVALVQNWPHYDTLGVHEQAIHFGINNFRIHPAIVGQPFFVQRFFFFFSPFTTVHMHNTRMLFHSVKQQQKYVDLDL